MVRDCICPISLIYAINFMMQKSHAYLCA
jgi:hypothetical protein